jgi:hypothetical protein
VALQNYSRPAPVWAESIFALDLALCNLKQYGFVTNIPTAGSNRSHPHKSSRQISVPFWRHDGPHVVSHKLQKSAHWVSLHSKVGQQWNFAFILFVMWRRLVLMWRTAFDRKAVLWRRKQMCLQNELCCFQTAFQFILSPLWQNIRDYHHRSTSYVQGLNVHEFRN